MPDEHVPLDVLADADAGLLDPARAEQVATHLAGCPACRQRHARLQQVDAKLAALAALPAPPVPPEVAARLDAALAAATAAEGTPGRTVVPLSAPGSRRARYAAAAAAAAAAALIAGIVVSHESASPHRSVTAGPGGEPAPLAGTGATGSASLPSLVHTAPSGFTSRDLVKGLTTELSASGNAPIRSAAQQEAPLASPRYGKKLRAASGPARTRLPRSLLALRHSPSRLQDCLSQVTATTIGPAPLGIFLTTYDGRPAVIVVVRDRYDPTMADAYVTGPDCGLPSALNDQVVYRSFPLR